MLRRATRAEVARWRDENLSKAQELVDQAQTALARADEEAARVESAAAAKEQSAVAHADRVRQESERDAAALLAAAREDADRIRREAREQAERLVSDATALTSKMAALVDDVVRPLRALEEALAGGSRAGTGSSGADPGVPGPDATSAPTGESGPRS